MRLAPTRDEDFARWSARIPTLVAKARETQDARDYEQVLYHVHDPLTGDDATRVLRYVHEHPDQAWATKWIDDAPYPALAGVLPPGITPRAWSALLHFHDPSYPIETPGARAALARLGYQVTSYVEYAAAFEDVKERLPPSGVPETNWYLTRVAQVALDAI